MPRTVFVMVMVSLMSATAMAGPQIMAEQACLVERLPQARAACFGALADQINLRIDSRIEASTADLQTASAAEIRAFERELRASQRRWLRQVKEECRLAAPDDKVAFQECRLSTAKARLQTVTETLNTARVQLGAAPLMDQTDSVEVLIPLPGVPNGPDADIRVPLEIPVTR